MPQSPALQAVSHGSPYPSPPRVHWSVLLVALIGAEVLAARFVPEPYRNFAIYFVAVAWPIYLCIWIRKLDPRSSSLYWAIASLVTGFGFLFSWLLWIVVIFELREELLEHYNRREPRHLRLNFLLTILGSFVYFQHSLNRIAKEKETAPESVPAESGSSVPA
jgi:Na+-transporting NADH:ubiquinone oxidoreductase subunit NqrE